MYVQMLEIGQSPPCAVSYVLCIAHDELHPLPLLASLGSSGLVMVKKANMVGEDELVIEYLLCIIV